MLLAGSYYPIYMTPTSNTTGQYRLLLIPSAHLQLTVVPLLITD